MRAILFRATAVAIVATAARALGSPMAFGRTAYSVKDSHPVPRGWSNIGTAPSDHVINVQIGLTQHQVQELERNLYEVSDPSHVRYGQHLSSGEVNALVAPSKNAQSLVHDWLRFENIDFSTLQYSPAKDWIKIGLRVGQLERLLDTKYSVFEHDDGDRIVRAPIWSLPSHLLEHIDTIQPTNSFMRPAGRTSTLKTVVPVKEIAKAPNPQVPNSPATPNPDASVAAACNTSAVTPTCLRTLYGTIKYKPQAPGKNQIGLTDFLREANNRSDIKLFLEKYRPDAVSEAENFKVDLFNGGVDQQMPNTPAQNDVGKDLEGNLDAETIIGIDYPTPLTAFITGGVPPFDPDDLNPTNTNEAYLDFLTAVLAKQDIPQIISSSYGDDEQTVPEAYAKRVCNQFMQLGARGVTFLTASGDNGVGATGGCFTNDGKHTSTFLSSFPDGCPYVTSVGATKGINPEVAAFNPRNGFASGGGFSNYFQRPVYQDSRNVVSDYVSSLNGEYKGLFNHNGRAYPDISAQGQAFVTIWNGNVTLLDGTSAATPTAASVLALVNDALIAAGKPVLGFLNPWLYSQGSQAFTDITSGSSRGCGSAGFPAVAGWDPVTGFGTPYFPSIKSLALQNFGGPSRE